MVDEVAESLSGTTPRPTVRSPKMVGQLTGEETYGMDVIRDAETLGLRCAEHIP